MSLFFEDEIKRAREKADSLGLNDFMFQDPRSNKRTSREKNIERADAQAGYG